MGTQRDEQVYAILKRTGLVDPEALDRAMQSCREDGQSLLEILMEQGSLGAAQVTDILLSLAGSIDTGEGGEPEEARGEVRPEVSISDERLGKLVLAKELVTEETLRRAVERARTTGHPLWRTLINLKLVLPKDIMEIVRVESAVEARVSQEQLLLDALRDRGLLSSSDLESLKRRKQETSLDLEQILVEERGFTLAQLGRALSESLRVPYVNLASVGIEPEALTALPETFAKENLLIPYGLVEGRLRVALANPRYAGLVEQIEAVAGYPVEVAVSTDMEVRKALADAYGGKVVSGASDNRGSLRETAEDAVRMLSRSGLPERVETMGAVQLVNTILEAGVRARATDVHLEPQMPEMRVRYRIDGMLIDVLTVPSSLQAQVISRLKILAEMDITETRLPQDGHFTTRVNGGDYQTRVATIPTRLGEKMVIRLLADANVLTGLKQLGLETEDELLLRELIGTPHGMILVTGPIGCGKTTTLYSALNEVNILTNNIITIEDPVEYQLAGINQVEVDPKIGFTFATGLRAFMRQDADILMVGEIRDGETAQVAVRAALTGQQVFSTLHTIDTPSAITRLKDLGIEPFLIASGLTGVVAQRLVRTLCQRCKRFYEPQEALLRRMGIPEEGGSALFAYGEGCPQCFHTGFRGRSGIFEILEVTREVRRLIVEGASEAEVREEAFRGRKALLRNNGIKKILRGSTTPEEVMKEITLVGS